MTLPAHRVCPDCGAAVPAEAPAGFCPRCELLGALNVSKPGSATAPATAPGILDTRIRYFGDYELLSEIARGGMGVVFKARQLSLNRLVAIKMILSGHFASPDARRRFRAEAEAAARLQHPNIVAIHEVGEHEGQPYFSMDFVEGQNLAELVRHGPLPARRAVVYLKTIAETIHFAHQRGTLHRDLKPSNVLIDCFDQPRITDFGLAKRLDAESDSAGPSPHASLTVSGQVLGSPNFMPPEQASGRPHAATPQADVYALGAMFYHLLTGRPPFTADSIPAILHQVVHDDPVAPRLLNPLLPEDLETICSKCLEKDPARRYPTALALAEDLGRFLRDEPIHARPAGPWARARKWARRNPAPAVLLPLLGLVFLSGFAGVYWQWRRAENHAREETRQRQKTLETLNRLELRRAEDYFAAGNTSLGLSQLARVLRANPSNTTATARLLSALSHRSFPLPLIPPIEHQSEIWPGRFSPDGGRIATASRDRTARIWDARSGAPLTPPLAHSNWVAWIEFSPDGQLLATASGDHTARLWNAHTGEPASGPLAHERAVNSLGFSPDSKRLVTAGDDGTARVWDTTTGTLLGTLPHRGAVQLASFSPDSRFIFTVPGDGRVHLFDAQTYSRIGNALLHSATVTAAASSPDSLSILTGTAQGTACLWNVQGGQILTQSMLHARGSTLTLAAFSPDGALVLTAGHDKTARTWNAQTLAPISPPLEHGAELDYAAFSPEGGRVVTASRDYTARLWDARTGQSLAEPIHHEGNVRFAQFSPDGNHVLTTSTDHSACLWDIQEGDMRGELFSHYNSVNAAAFTPDARRLATASKDATVRLWDLDTGLPIGSPLRHEGEVHSLEFSPDGSILLTASHDKTARLWNAATGEPLGKPMTHAAPVKLARFSPKGSLCLTLSDRFLQLWRVPSALPDSQPLTHPANLEFAEFSPDGALIATCGWFLGPLLWDAALGTQRLKVAEHGNMVWKIRFSPDGRHVATASADGTARLWSVATGQPALAPLKHDSSVRHVAFSPDGHRLVTGSKVHGARIWDVLTGRPLSDPLPHSGTVHHAEFSPHGRWLVTASADKTARLWDGQLGYPLTEPLAHRDEVRTAHFSPDSSRLVTTSTDGSARVWEMLAPEAPAPSWLPELAETIAHRRRNADDLVEPVPLTQFHALAAKLRSDPSPDFFHRWARWFLDSRASRNVSLLTQRSRTDYVQRLIRQNTDASLREAVRLAPTNVTATAALARFLVIQMPGTNSTLLGEAEWWSRCALTLAPHDPLSCWARALWLERTGQLSEAVPLFDRVPTSFGSAAFWHDKAMLLQKTGQLEEALRCFTVALQKLQEPDTKPDVAARRIYANRMLLLRRLGRIQESLQDQLASKGIPPRDPSAPSKLIDLSAYYTSGLSNVWLSSRLDSSLAALPHGPKVLEGIPFDLRGLIQLAGSPAEDRRFMDNVTNIVVSHSAIQLHFLHATQRQLPANASIGYYTVHYEDGSTLDLPLEYGHNILDWCPPPDSAPDLLSARVAWRGTRLNSTDSAQPCALYCWSWTNPHPDRKIQSLDFTSTRTLCAPFLIALTVELPAEQP